MIERYIDEKKRKQIELLLSDGVSMQLVPTKDSLAIRCFQDSTFKHDRRIDKIRLSTIEKTLLKGYRVELMPYNDSFKILIVKPIK